MTVCSAPEPSIIVIMRCPPSVRPGVVVDFHSFDFSSENAERNSTKLYRMQDFNVLYQDCVLCLSEKQYRRPGSDLLRHFRRLWNSWMELNKTW